MQNNKTVAIGCDHAGFPYKDEIIDLLREKGYEVLDAGTFSKDSVDYPDFVHPVCENIEKGTAALGVLLCGSGNGVAMTANKHQSIRAAVCWNEEIAALARQHNNANIIAIPVRFVDVQLACSMVATFMKECFEGGRHARRVNKISLSC